MNDLDRKINEHFEGLVVRKDLVKTVKGNAIVPSYVLEYLLGQYCATQDEKSIESGIETVKEILRKHYVHRNEAGLVKSTIKEKGRHKVIDKVSVSLNDKRGVYEAQFANLGIKDVLVDTDTVKRHPRLLVSGVWCIADLEYEYSEDTKISPWILGMLKPIQLSNFDFDRYVAARKKFTTDEWIDLLVQSIGFNPELFGKRSKLFQLVRLIPYCERNYNLIELGPKGTGKSHIYSEFSPHGILISGGEVTVPKLFVNNVNGKLGLVGYWDAVAFDEFAGKDKTSDKALVDILKNYMANKTFSRGVETIGAEASMVFVGNTQHNLPYMLKHADLFDDLPAKYHDSAFLDRLHFYLPGWEVDIIRGEMFSEGYGFVVDYLAELMRDMRNRDYSHLYNEHFELLKEISTRDRDGVQKTFSGLMKILYPHQEATKEEAEEILRFSMEGRKRVKDQLMRIDTTYAVVDFGYKDLKSGKTLHLFTLEEQQYPQYFQRKLSTSADEVGLVESASALAEEKEKAQGVPIEKKPEPGHYAFQENQKGVTFDALFGVHLKGATSITITDPYIRAFYQIRNFMELVETVIRLKGDDEEVKIHLVTTPDGMYPDKQADNLAKIEENVAIAGINFTWEFNTSGGLHARHIVTDTGWKISLDRGLDIYQQYEMNDAFVLANRGQQYRPCKAFEVTYLKVEE
jgi:ATP-dependent Lon protease